MHIQPIKCPQCGSTHKTQIDHELYCCDNCNTQYHCSHYHQKILHQHTHQKNELAFHSKLIPILIIITFVIVVAIWFQLSKDEPQQGTVISPKVIEQRPRATVPNNEIIPYPPQEISENIPPVKDSCQLPFSLPAKDFLFMQEVGTKGKI